MPIIKEVGIKIESVIENLDPSGMIDGEAEKTLTEVRGMLNCRDDSVIITYTEKNEGAELISEITVRDGGVTVKRTGAIESELYFKEGEEHKSIYSMPPYKFDACVKTRRIRNNLTENGGTLDLFYNMRIGGADKSARMKIWICPNSDKS